jgi:dCMP deaminase
MKLKFIEAHMKAAEVYAELSSATRLHVGCVVVKDNTIIGIGYNGMPSGWDNNCEEEMKWPNGHIAHLKTKPEVIHAEANAIAKLAKSTESGDGAVMFLTHAPCIDCAKQIYTTGISKVYFGEQYRSTDGIDFLHKCKIEVEQI